MKTARFKTLLAALPVLLATAAAHADAPLRTDNAYVADPGTAKLEALAEGTRHDYAYGATASYVVLDGIELAGGYARGHADDDAWSNNLALQAKFALVKEADERPFALAATLAIARDTGEPSGRTAFQTGWLNVPASYAMLDAALRFHLNAGALWRSGGSTLATWGAAAEYDVGAVTLLGEAYRIDEGVGRYNAGARYVFSPLFSVYVSAGRRFGSDPGDWRWTAGIKLESDRLFR